MINPISILPKDMLGMIFSYVDIGDFISCHQLSKQWNQLLSEDTFKKNFWKTIAERIGLSIEPGISDVRNRVYTLISDLNEVIKHLSALNPPEELADKLQNLLLPSSTTEEVKLCKAFLDTVSTLTVWAEMARKIGQKVPGLENCISLEAMLIKAKEFSGWCAMHQAELNGITRLDLRDCHLITLPPEVGQLTNLTHLDLGKNQLTNLPPEIGKLTRLKQIFINDTRITRIPKEVTRFRFVKEGPPPPPSALPCTTKNLIKCAALVALVAVTYQFYYSSALSGV